MLDLKKYFTRVAARKNSETPQKLKWLPKHQGDEQAAAGPGARSGAFEHPVHIMAFCGHECYYRIDAWPNKNRNTSGKTPYQITLTSYYPLAEMCVKHGGTKKLAALHHNVLPTAGGQGEHKRIVEELKERAEAHYAQVLKALELGKER